jgi:hypothetical protein
MFSAGGVLYRQINPVAAEDYELLRSSGLYTALTTAGDLVAHDEVDARLSPDGLAFRVIRPERIAFVSYPYEWSFSQLKDAALLTLRIQKAAMARGMSLKDATAFNIAFDRGRPVLIDTLSFERHAARRPWVAYRQFCEMFLAPLALMATVDVRLSQLLRTFIDGVPLDLARKLLPWRTRLRPGLLIHLHLHATAQGAMADKTPRKRETQLGENALPALIDSLERTVQRLDWRPAGTVWGDYYEATNYTDVSFEHKRLIVNDAIERLAPRTVWDLGANDGTFSRLASDRGIPTVACDIDPAAVEKNYRAIRTRGERHLVPVLLDLTNPTAASGWANRERESFAARGPTDLALALALIHHLAIAHNVPLEHVAAFFASVAGALVIEFVPKEDSQVQRMLATREDVFPGYTQAAFERAFAAHFHIEQTTPVRDSVRTVYVMRRR